MPHALHPAHIAALNHQAQLPLLANFAVRFAVVVTKWDMRSKTRCALKHLDEHLLVDIGVDQSAADAEASKPFWQD
jgi:uncharacterized protein YjiS (DUF1127 family)